MRPNILSRTRRWIGASALALLVAIGGVSTALVATSQQANAQVQPAAQIVVPPITPSAGFADLVDSVKPAVVSILVEGKEAPGAGPDGSGGAQPNFNFPDLPDGSPFKDFFNQFGGGQGGANGAKPELRKFMAAGSGFIISADGYIVTNNHVVENATKVTVVFENGDEKVAKVIGADQRSDLAVIKIDDGTDLPFVKLEDTRSRVGDWVVAVGNPFGLGGTVTVGIISAEGRDIGGSSYGDFLQIDAAVNTGNSGGPDFNMKGEVVGVNTAIYSPNGGNVGIAFAIPASTVKQISDQLIKGGSVVRGYLGVSIQDVTHDIADSVGLKSAKGAIVREPAADGPALKAGVQSGDIITAVDGKDINDALDLSRTIAGKAPTTPVELTIWRNGAEVKVSVTLQTLTEDAAKADDTQAPTPPKEVAPTKSSVGLTLVPNSDGTGGLLIQDVDPDSAAADKGFAVGDAILEVNNTKVASVAEFETALKAVKDKGLNTALIKASRDGEARFIGLPLSN